jgi:hypothetical protein
MFSRFGFVVIAVALGACTDTQSQTNLNPDGPPEIAQVRLRESYTRMGSTTVMARTVFGFGSHPMATSDDEHPVTTASAAGQKLRIIVDELLVGNALEEVQCRGVVDDDAFDSVPIGATPDDIAKCSVAEDTLKVQCTGPHAVCICHNQGGCGTVAFGDPVGVLDVNQDGAADNTSFKKGAAGIQCGNIDVPIDLDMSYWNPSGDQQVPAVGGFDALGPAIVLAPQGGYMPTNVTCGLKFADDIVDKQGNKVCAPPMGRPADCVDELALCPVSEFTCNPGDVSAFTFKVEPMRLNVLGLVDGAVGIDPTQPIYINSTVPLDPASIQNVTLTPAPAQAPVISAPMPIQIKITPTVTFGAATAFTLTIPLTVTDSFGQPAPMAIVIHFTTA